MRQSMKLSWTDVAIRLHPSDDVLVATRLIEAGSVVELPDSVATTRNPIPFCHKIALRKIEPGRPVRKYGQIIGFATKPIEPGDHVHVQNMECGSYSRDDAPIDQAATLPSMTEDKTFDGFLRSDGRVGTRNYLAIVGTVNCSSAVVRRIAEKFTPEVLRNIPNVDGVFAVAHQTGCGMSASGLDRTYLKRTLSGA